LAVINKHDVRDDTNVKTLLGLSADPMNGPITKADLAAFGDKLTGALEKLAAAMISDKQQSFQDRLNKK